MSQGPSENGSIYIDENGNMKYNVTILFSVLLVISGGLLVLSIMVHYAKTHKRQAF